MKVNDIKGDLFSAPDDAIGHGVNIYGLMGAGVAKVIHNKFPATYNTYWTHCATAQLKPGTNLITGESRGAGIKYIFNMATQIAPGSDARYDLVELCFLEARVQLEYLGVESIAIPRIGCGIGGLDWDKVKTTIEKVVSDVEVNAYYLED